AAVGEDTAGMAEPAEASGTEETTTAPDATEAAVGEEAREIPPVTGETAREAEVVDLTQRLRRWRGGAAVLGALAAAFAAIIVTAALAPEYLPEPLRPQPEVRTVEVPREVVRTVEVPAPAPGRFVAVLQSSAAAPAFIITVDVAQQSLTVRRVAAEDQTDHSYELWLVSDRFQTPRSLGLIGTSEFTKVPTLTNYDPDTISDATFAVSLEPVGGSPTGQATGPILFSGKLVEAVPPTQPPPNP
ncbi:MAG: anti-sigma factor, partial [Xanthobacteraceae bacterium]